MPARIAPAGATWPAADGPGVDRQPGICALEVSVEHDGEGALWVVTPLGGGEGGALPCCAGLPGGRPGGDHFEQRIRFCCGHAGLEQSLPCRWHELGDQFGGGQGPHSVPVPGWPAQLGGQAVLGGTVEAMIGTFERQCVRPLLVLFR